MTDGQKAKEWFYALDHAFTGFYLVEFAARLTMSGGQFFKECMDLFDIGLVIANCLDLYLLQMVLQAEAGRTGDSTASEDDGAQDVLRNIECLLQDTRVHFTLELDADGRRVPWCRRQSRKSFVADSLAGGFGMSVARALGEPCRACVLAATSG